MYMKPQWNHGVGDTENTCATLTHYL